MKNKEIFEAPAMEIIEIEVNDVIATSGEDKLTFDLPTDAIDFGIAD